MYADIQLEGAEELNRKLSSLEPDIGKAITRMAFKKSIQIYIDAAKANIMSMVGGIMAGYLWQAWEVVVIPTRNRRKYSYGIRAEISPRRNNIFVYIAKHYSRLRGGRSYIPNAIEYGHIAADGSFVPAIPFARAAWSQVEGQIESSAESELSAAINEAWNSANPSAEATPSVWR